MKDFLSIADLDRKTIEEIFDISHQLKYVPSQHRPLDGKTLVLLFEKSSTRTRASFQIGMYHLGGKAIYLSATDSQIGRGESIMDTAKVLSRYADATVIRTYDHLRLTEYARFADHPVINGLSDLLHPCQVLADIFTIKEKFDKAIEDIKICYLGDGNNMTNSFINAAVKLGFNFTVGSPEGFLPDQDIMKEAESKGANVSYHQDPVEAVSGADVVYTDVWSSMDLKEKLKKEGKNRDEDFVREMDKRKDIFMPYQVNKELFSHASDDAVFLHCLPAHRGEEVSAEVIDGPSSMIYDQSENRLHVQKAILTVLMR